MCFVYEGGGIGGPSFYSLLVGADGLYFLSLISIFLGSSPLVSKSLFRMMD